MNIKNLSVFFPCVNEEGNLEYTVNKAINILQGLKLDYEILIINDGSTDSTGLIADRLARENKCIKVIHHPSNLGYGEALKSGFYNAKFDTIVYTDGDRQFDFSEVTKFIDKLDEADLIIGYRIKRQDPLFRLLFTKGWALSLFAFFRLRLRDVDCGFKMVKKEVLNKIPKLESQRGAMINAELAIKTKKMGFRVAQVGVNHYPRFSGRPTGANIKVIVKSYIDLIKLWWKIKQGKHLFILLLTVLALAAFLRFYRLPEYMTFLGDEGRDALVIKSILVDRHIPLIGPPTSIGNIYLGPLYYYMMAVPMAIFWLNPVAAAGMNAAIGVFTVFIVYYLSKLWFGKEAGILASFLYAVSPVTVIYSRSSWNPNPAPFFASLGIYGLYKTFNNKNAMWLILSGISVAAAAQMHYLALILIPISFIIWVGGIINCYNKKKLPKYLISGTLLGVLSFMFVMSPLVWFDLRHNFLNYKAGTELISGGQAIQMNLLANVSKIPNIFLNNLIGRYIASQNQYLAIFISLLILIPILIKRNWQIFILVTWIFIGIFGLSFYQQNIYDHYFGFLNPAPFILIGAVFIFLRTIKNIHIKILASYIFVAFMVLVGILNLLKSPLRDSPNNQLGKTQKVARFVLERVGNRDFNFALLSKNNYDAAYQFYFDRFGNPPKQVPFDITDQLFVVCEDPVCQPINNSKYEIAGFGWAKIVSEENIAGVKVFKLVHNPTGKP